jgi:hypothetical protein
VIILSSINKIYHQNSIIIGEFPAGGFIPSRKWWLKNFAAFPATEPFALFSALF